MKQLFEIDCDGGRVGADFIEYLQEQFKLLPLPSTCRKRDFVIKVKEITDRPVTVLVDVGGKEFQGIVRKIADEVRVKANKQDVGTRRLFSDLSSLANTCGHSVQTGECFPGPGDDCSKCSSSHKREKEKTKAVEKDYDDILSKSCNSASSLKEHWENSFFEKYGMDLDPYAHPTAIIDNADIGKGTKIWHFSHISDGASVGENCTIGQNVFIGEGVKIGRGCKIQNNVFIPKGVGIESEIFLGPSVTFTNVTNPRAFISRKGEFKETIVRHGASIGANATILPGITIGRYAMIGAGAVVTKDIDDGGAVAFGNPARVVGSISMKGDVITYFK